MKTSNSTKEKKSLSSALELLIYRIAVSLYVFLIKIASLFNSKARKWVQGRQNWYKELESAFKKIPKNNDILWFHCASLGEFEQGRPLIEAIKNQYPNKKILLSFFSPSGYEIRKNYAFADYVCYLPVDNQTNAMKWLDLIQPKAVFFIKYEFWYYFLKETKSREIPLFLVSASFRPSQLFFNRNVGMFSAMLHFFTKIFVQDEASKSLLEKNGFSNAVRCGDTRIDSVLNIKKQPKDLPLIESFKHDSKLLICGSTWPLDENIILNIFNNRKEQNLKLIIAPHEIEKYKIQALFIKCSKIAATALYSEALKSDDCESIKQVKILIIDNIGLLKHIYRYGNLAFIGGGFGKGIHNILEAAVHKIPVFFGPKHKKFTEAKNLLNLGAAFEINNAKELNDRISNIDYEAVADKLEYYFNSEKGATLKIIEEFKKAMQ